MPNRLIRRLVCSLFLYTPLVLAQVTEIEQEGIERTAAAAARKALQIGGLRDAGKAWLVVGMALARGDELVAARKAFQEAVAYEQTEQWARQWLNFVDSEQRRIAALTSVN